MSLLFPFPLFFHFLKSQLVLKLPLQLRQLQHENVVHFLGASIEAPTAVILTAHCSRGSLQDILSNDQINIDWMFKVSLMTDLVNGLHYIQTCPLISHGALQTDNCTVDNRWVLKVGHVGLKFIRRLNVSDLQATKGKEKLKMNYLKVYV